MIRYSLKCTQGHGFESWFRSAEAFDTLCAARLISCPECGTPEVSKALMAPRLATEKSEAPKTTEDAARVGKPDDTAPVATTNMPEPMREAIKALRAEVEKNSDYVGRRFANEARAMHEGTSPERAIHGEANAEEARALLEDGIPVLPLPFRDPRGTN